eukprot:2618048-Pyramimonas_sp.AAC.1
MASRAFQTRSGVGRKVRRRQSISHPSTTSRPHETESLCRGSPRASRVRDTPARRSRTTASLVENTT